MENTEEAEVKKNRMVTISLPSKELGILEDLGNKAGVPVAQIFRGYMRLGVKTEGTSVSNLLKISRAGSLE